MTGFPVQLLDRLMAAAAAEAVDRAVAAEAALDVAASDLAAVLADARIESRKIHKRLERRESLDDVGDARLAGELASSVRSSLDRYQSAIGCARDAGARAVETYEGEVIRTRVALYEQVRDERFRQALLLSAPTFEALTPPPGLPPARNHKARERELTWLSYLQRLTMKNESVSFFGPIAWGVTDGDRERAVDVRLNDPPALESDVVLERWVVLELVRVLADDPDVTGMHTDALCDCVRAEEDAAVDVLSGRRVPWSPSTRDALVMAGGRPLGAGVLADELAALSAGGMTERRGRLPRGPRPLATFANRVGALAAGVGRTRWLARIAELEALCAAFARARELEERRTLLTTLNAILEGWGVHIERTAQALYASRLPLTEFCRREGVSSQLGGAVVEQLTEDAVPWYEFWRDLAGLYATRLFELVLPIWQGLARDGKVPLPVLLRAMEQRKLPIGLAGGTGLPWGLEAEIQAAWEEELGDRASADEVVIGEAELSFLRRRFRFRRMRAFDWPAPDVQVLGSPEDIRAGRGQVLIAELHPTFVMWGQVGFTWCPDQKAQAEEALAAGTRPVVEFAAARNELQTAHMFNCAPLYLPGWTSTSGSDVEGTEVLRGAELDVALEDDDLVLKDAAGGVRGSLLQTWAVASSTHQLQLHGLRRTTPRLKVGRVIVQRRTWLIESPEVLLDPKASASAAYAAIRRFRAAQGLPEELYVTARLPVRGTQFKDGKPLYVDLRSPLLVELLVAHMRRYRKLRVSEALPGRDACWIEDARGRYSCEFRMATRPAKPRAS